MIVELDKEDVEVVAGALSHSQSLSRVLSAFSFLPGGYTFNRLMLKEPPRGITPPEVEVGAMSVDETADDT